MRSSERLIKVIENNLASFTVGEQTRVPRVRHLIKSISHLMLVQFVKYESDVDVSPDRVNHKVGEDGLRHKVQILGPFRKNDKSNYSNIISLRLERKRLSIHY